MQKFQTPSPISTTLDIPAGRIRFIAADRTDTTVEILPADPTRSRDLKAAQLTTADYRDGTLHIETAPAKNRVLGHPGSIEVTVQLPTGSSVQAKTATAELRGVGRLGDITYESAQGSIKLDEATSAHLTLLAGDITLGRLDGPARISTAQGDIHITEATRGTVTLHTQAGDISIGVTRGASASLDAGTTYGRIHNALNNTDPTTTLTIHATTAHGDITARSL
ncbi:DUF4097 family beta strand repeat-containing protein [Kitasatospora sp. NPDC049258]|uniref:DUF4097 family beta strand repeat-containing protein n=1 Tax=Kitasatospora sp. NPDC049258 TaxID=3155394 RepID=UPI00344623E5